MNNTGFPAIDSIPALEVYDLTYKKLARLNNNTPLSAHSIVVDKKLNSVWTLTFELSLDSPNYKFLINENLIKFDGEYYFIKNPEIQHSVDAKKDVINCLHLSSGLNNQIQEVIDLVGLSAMDLMINLLQTSHSGWVVGVVDVGSDRKSLQTNDQSIFSNLVQLGALYSGNLYFHSDTRTVDLLSYTSTYIPDRNIQIRKSKNLKSLNYIPDTTGLVTRLYVFGGDSENGSGAISIVSVNPSGQSFIEDYSFYLNQGYTQDYINAHPELFLHCQRWNANSYLDPQLLYDDAKKKLTQISQPIISTKIEGVDLACFPNSFTQSCVLGETVHIFDPDINTSISAQVTEIKKDYDNPLNLSISLENTIVYSSIISQLVDSSKLSQKNVNGLGTARGSVIVGAISSANGNTVINLDDNTAKFGSVAGRQFLVNSDGSITTPNISADTISGGTINGNNVNVTNLNASNITAGTFSADKISGGTLALGLVNGIDGVMSVTSSIGNNCATINKTGSHFYVNLTGDGGLIDSDFAIYHGGLGASPYPLFSIDGEFYGIFNCPVKVHNTMYIDNNLYVTGNKNCIQMTKNYGGRAINAYETAEYYFGDIGRNRIVDGSCTVPIEDIFKECVNTEIQYEVFLTKYGKGDIWVDSMDKDSFVVKGDDISFGWEVKAKRRGCEDNRLVEIEL